MYHTSFQIIDDPGAVDALEYGIQQLYCGDTSWELLTARRQVAHYKVAP